MLTNKKSEDAWSPVFWLAKYLKQMSPAVGPENKTLLDLDLNFPLYIIDFISKTFRATHNQEQRCFQERSSG